MDEATLQRKIRKALEARGAYVFKVHGGRFSQGVPDLCGCYESLFFGFEVKLPGKERTLTELQQHNLENITAAGGLGVMVTSVHQTLDALDSWLEGPR